jgi:hypothetical protein
VTKISPTHAAQASRGILVRSGLEHEGEAGIAQDRAVLPQKPGTATTPEGGIATAVSPSASPEWPCLCGARNRLRDLVCRNCGAPKP